MNVCTIGIFSDEGKPPTYQGVWVHTRKMGSTEHDGVTEQIFMTGDPVKDFIDAGNSIDDSMTVVMLSSSVDHFITDCAGLYEWYEDEDSIEWFRKVESCSN